MTLKRQLASGAATLTAGKLLSTGSAFARYLILIDLLGPFHMGVAATFTMTVTFIEAVSALSVEKLLVQDRDGNSRSLQANMHSIQVIRGVFMALVVVALAGPMASLMSVPEAAWAYRAIAIVPLLRGFMHLDAKRWHRKLRYGPDVLVEAVAQMLALALAWPIAAMLESYMAALALLLISHAGQLVMTHIVARRPYSFGWRREYAERALAFGWPLVVNGILMFLILQGDRFVIGSAREVFGAPYTMADLGSYAVAFLLATAPTMFLGSIGTSLLLPSLSRVQDNPTSFARHYSVSIQVVALIAAIVGSAFVLAGPWTVRALYGPEYALAGSLIAWLGAMEALRFVRIGFSLTAMARGDTKTTMLCNFARISGFVGAVAAAAAHAPLVYIPIAGLFSEALALLVAIWRALVRHSLPRAASLAPAGATVTILSIAFLLSTIHSAATQIAGITIAIGAMIIGLPDARRVLLSLSWRNVVSLLRRSPAA